MEVLPSATLLQCLLFRAFDFKFNAVGAHVRRSCRVMVCVVWWYASRARGKVYCVY